MKIADYISLPEENREDLCQISLFWLYPRTVIGIWLVTYILDANMILQAGIQTKEILQSVQLGLCIGVPVLALQKWMIRSNADLFARAVLRYFREGVRRSQCAPSISGWKAFLILNLCILPSYIGAVLISEFAGRQHISILPAHLTLGILLLAIYPELKTAFSEVRYKIEAAKSSDSPASPVCPRD